MFQTMPNYLCTNHVNYPTEKKFIYLIEKRKGSREDPCITLYLRKPDIDKTASHFRTTRIRTKGEQHKKLVTKVSDEKPKKEDSDHSL